VLDDERLKQRKKEVTKMKSNERNRFNFLTRKVMIIEYKYGTLNSFNYFKH
jgi:hypothetical protein